MLKLTFKELSVLQQPGTKVRAELHGEGQVNCTLVLDEGFPMWKCDDTGALVTIDNEEEWGPDGFHDVYQLTNLGD